MLLLLPLLLMAGLITIVVYVEVYEYKDYIPLYFPPLMILSMMFPLLILPFFFAGLAAFLTQSDRNKKVSSFLVTLSTTRNRIFAARIFSGVITICVLLVPLIVTDIILIQAYPRLIPIPVFYLVMMFLITFLANLVGYIIGLLLGENPSRIIAILGTIILVAVLLLTVIIKCFEWELGLILVLLAAAGLQNKEIAGAGLDVMDPEPLPPENPMWEMENVIMTPHHGGVSTKAPPRQFKLYCDNLQRYVAGQPLINVVDKIRRY